MSWGPEPTEDAGQPLLGLLVAPSVFSLIEGLIDALPGALRNVSLGLLAGYASVPAATMAAASAATAAVALLGLLVDPLGAALAHLLYFMAVLGVMGVAVAEDAVGMVVTTAGAGVVGATALTTLVMLLVRLDDEHRGWLALDVLLLCGRDVGLLGPEVVGEQPAILGLGALVHELEELDYGVKGVMDGELLAHHHIGDAHREGGDDLRVGDAGDIVADLAEALDALT